MIESLFDDLLPPPRELDAFIAAHVLGWQEVRSPHAHGTYVGKKPDSATERPVPRFTELEDLVETVRTALRSLGYCVQGTPVPEGWRAQVGEEAATLRTPPLALCAAAWKCLRARR